MIQIENDEPPEPPASSSTLLSSASPAAAGDHRPPLPTIAKPALDDALSPTAADADAVTVAGARVDPLCTDALRLLNRSPHPYHRRRQQLREPTAGSNPSSTASSDYENNDSNNDGDNAKMSKRQRAAPTSYPSQAASRSMSESGTEADDEGYGFVKALPAPFIRPHKGLRDVKDADAANDSGLLTPSVLEEEGRRLSAAPGYYSQRRGKGGVEDETVEDERVKRERERFVKRRRAEMLRRGCEVMLLAAIGAVVLRGAMARKSLDAWSRAELSGYVALCALLVLLYPATVRRWLYAGWVYIAMALLILAPIRAFIGKFALNGQEPFGWAIGYLLGNIRDVRFFIFDWGLSGWISLPPLPDFTAEDLAQLSRAEFVRQIVFGGAANTRLLITGYWVLILTLGMATVLSLSTTVEVDTRRKVFHGMMVAMLLPTIFIDSCFIALTLALVLSVFCLLDLIRAAQLPPLSKPLAYFLTPYVDGRDLRGPVVVSHIFLLIGCAIPLWLSLAGASRDDGEEGGPWRGWEARGPKDVSMVAGVVCVGMGDAAASLIGRRWGRRKWPWLGGKSLEGSIAFAAAVTMGLVFGKAWLRLGQWDGSGVVGEGAHALWPGFRDVLGLVRPVDVGKAACAGAAASFMEAVLTGGNDNVVVPVVLWLVVRGLGV
ncbi:Dolichol kinase sec59 [Lasiodiplodia theobromae]|uniref:dolichol kinase n=1 Tax=Lasiodiplodia theobromae TaxID=45133 RepID=A0A5N5DL41_9PEZI|nr:Dolichol kinase sec59 [Lasiodiplodia theobromae]